MTILQLIKRLKDVESRYGNIDVVRHDDSPVTYVEVVDTSRVIFRAETPLRKPIGKSNESRITTDR